MNIQGGQHRQAIPGQDSRVRNNTSSAGQDHGRREENETQAQVRDILSLRCVMINGRITPADTGCSPPPQNVQSQIPVAPYTRNAYAGTMPEGPGTRRDMNGHNFATSSLGSNAYTNNTTNGSRGMIDPTLRSDNDNAVFLAPPYAHDLSVYEPQSSAAPMPDDQEFSDMSDGEIHDTSMDDELRAYDALPDVVLDYPCPVGSCPRRDRPFARWEEYMRHISRSNDRAHARLRAEIRRRGV